MRQKRWQKPKQFQSTLPVRGATAKRTQSASSAAFQSTLPVRGATGKGGGRNRRLAISIHAPRAGSDHGGMSNGTAAREFQSTLPVRGATWTRRTLRQISYSFQSTLPVRGATDWRCCCRNWIDNFNPRSPCGERLHIVVRRHPRRLISIHAPRAGSDPFPQPAHTDRANFNPRSPCGERLERVFYIISLTRISIHAPRAGSDIRTVCHRRVSAGFQSTLPVRGATIDQDKFVSSTIISIHAPRAGSDIYTLTPDIWATRISIHAPRAGSDWVALLYSPLSGYFNPRSPCGERRIADLDRRTRQSHFNPRSPCGERRNHLLSFQSWLHISIHAPRAGSDSEIYARQDGEGVFQSTLPVRGATGSNSSAETCAIYFNPRSPCGERPDFIRVAIKNPKISIHAPRAGSDRKYTVVKGDSLWISIHAPRAGSDLCKFRHNNYPFIFQSTLPVRGATVHRFA